MSFNELAAVASVVVLLALARWVWRVRSYADRSWLPRDLRDAKLVYAERVFKATEPLSLVAKLDRAYRGLDGVITLVELKTRPENRPYLSDVIELSAQRVALEAQTGQRVADYGYVLIQRSTGGPKIPHRVELLSTEKVTAVAARREAILAEKAIPNFTPFKGLCAQCAFRHKCPGPGAVVTYTLQ